MTVQTVVNEHLDTIAQCKAHVLAWIADALAVDKAHAVTMLKVGARLASAPRGQGGKVAAQVGLTSSQASQLLQARKVWLAASENDKADALDIFVNAWALSKAGNYPVAALAYDGKAKDGNAYRASVIAAHKASLADGTSTSKRAARPASVTDGTKPGSDANGGNVGNAHGGTGDTSAVKNGDNGDVVSDSLDAMIRTVTLALKDKTEAGEFSALVAKRLPSLETAILEYRVARDAVKDGAALVAA